MVVFLFVVDAVFFSGTASEMSLLVFLAAEELELEVEFDNVEDAALFADTFLVLFNFGGSAVSRTMTLSSADDTSTSPPAPALTARAAAFLEGRPRFFGVAITSADMILVPFSVCKKGTYDWNSMHMYTVHK